MESKKYDIYEVEEKDILGTFDNGEEFIYRTYKPFPREHEFTDNISKILLSNGSNALNKLKDSNDLIPDYSGSLFYKPNDVSKLKWSRGRSIPDELVIDVKKSETKLKVGDTFEYNGKKYRADNILNWGDITKIELMYCFVDNGE